MEVEVLGVAIDLQKDQERVLLPMVDTNKCIFWSRLRMVQVG